MRRFHWAAGLLTVSLAAGISGCQKQEIMETTEMVETEDRASVEALERPPEISLTDVLSGKSEPFTIISGNYHWRCQQEPFLQNEEIESMIASGIHPLELDLEKEKMIQIPDYEHMDGAVYLVSCSVRPDRIFLTCWDGEALGALESPAKESISYEEPFLLSLKPDMVYELRAVWEENKGTERGFFGEAGYAFLTESAPGRETDSQRQELVIRKKELSETETEQLALYASCPFMYKEKEWELQILVQEDMILEGELVLDDQGRFLIQAVSGEDAYLLFDETVQLGIPEADTWIDEADRLHIVLRDVRTARYRVTDFVYDPEKEEFLGNHVMDGEGINYLGTTGK